MAGGLAAVAAGLSSLAFLAADSGYSALWPAFGLLGAGIGLVLTASSDAIIGQADVGDAGVAGGLQSTAVQLGGVLGTTILGSVMSGRVGAVLFDKLVAAGTPVPVAIKLGVAKQVVAQGVTPPGLPAPLAGAVTRGGHDAFMAGLQVSMIVAAATAAVGAVLAMRVRREPAASGDRPLPGGSFVDRPVRVELDTQQLGGAVYDAHHDRGQVRDERVVWHPPRTARVGT